MPHVHSVSSDEDELDEHDWGLDDDQPRPIPWVPIAAAGGAVLLLIILIVVLMSGGGGKKTTTTTTAAGATTTTVALEALPADDPRVTAAQAALDAWGKFEGTGKVADLGNTMAKDGPQYKALQKKAAAFKPGTPGYTVVLTDPKLVPETEAQAQKGESTVRATLVWKREGKSGVSRNWDLTMRKVGDSDTWVLWTASEVPADGGVPVGDFCGAAKSAAAIPTNTDLNQRLTSIKTDEGKLAEIKDVLTKRAQAASQMAQLAPPELKTKMAAVAQGEAAYLQAISQAKTLAEVPDAEKKAQADPAFKAELDAAPAVVEYAKQQCQVTLSYDK